VFLRWRSGPVLFLLTLFWLVLADLMGHTPWSMIEHVVATFVGWLVASGRVLLPSRAPRRYLHGASPVLDVLFCAAALAYVAGHFRLLGLTRNLFPVERRRRPGRPGREERGAPAQPSEPEHKRSPALAEGGEVPALLLAVVFCSAAGQLLWLWLSGRHADRDLSALTGMGVDVRLPDGAWRALVLLWVFAVVLIPLTGLLSYLAHRRLTPEEAALYLQDQLWRETRREQSRINRWLAWAGLRRRRRDEARGGQRPGHEDEGGPKR
jgi:hypothetical protein